MKVEGPKTKQDYIDLEENLLMLINNKYLDEDSKKIVQVKLDICRKDMAKLFA